MRSSSFKNWAEEKEPEKEQSEQWWTTQRRGVPPKPRNLIFKNESMSDSHPLLVGPLGMQEWLAAEKGHWIWPLGCDAPCGTEQWRGMPARWQWAEVREEVAAANFEYSFNKFGNEGKERVGAEA